MRGLKVFSFFVFMICFVAYGVKIDLSVKNMPPTFNAASTGSKLGDCAKGNLFSIYNGSSSWIAVSPGDHRDNSAPTTDRFDVPPNTGIDRDGYYHWNGAQSVYARSTSGSTLTSGIISYDCGRK